VEGPGDVFICAECIELCQSIIDQEKVRRNRSVPNCSPAVWTQAIRAKLDQLIIGQDEAKEAFVRVAANRPEGTGHVLLIGPSPSSMALLARALARALDVPFAAGDRSGLVEANRGEPIPLLFKLLESGDFDLEASQQGVVYVDGVDQPDVRESLLALWQGKQGEFMDRIRLDARRVLFICGGAFAGLDDTIARLENHQPESVVCDALLAFGVRPEWVQHTAAIARVAPLDEDALARLVKWVDFPRAEQAPTTKQEWSPT
jgi:ATP-dependent Clp protease ATP-binding subunit ClpX